MFLYLNKNIITLKIIEDAVKIIHIQRGTRADNAKKKYSGISATTKLKTNTI